MENNNIYLTEMEVYQLAENVVNSICNDLNETIYKKLGGKLSIVWNTDERFNASAQILNKASDPPNHRITLYYFLVKELYREALAKLHKQPELTFFEKSCRC